MRMNKNKFLALLLFIIILISFENNLFAQELITDRPDITESAVTIPLNDVQIEDGFLFESMNQDNNGINFKTHNYTFSSSLFRIGILNNCELRIGCDYLYQTSNTYNYKTEISGFNNVLIGSKFQFMNEDSDGQDLGLLLQFYLPVGMEAIKPRGLEPELIFAYGKELTERVSLSANIGSHWNSYDENFTLMYSASFEIGLAGNLDSFFELYGEKPKSDKASFSFDFGLSYLLINNLQFDIST